MVAFHVTQTFFLERKAAPLYAYADLIRSSVSDALVEFPPKRDNIGLQ